MRPPRRRVQARGWSVGHFSAPERSADRFFAGSSVARLPLALTEILIDSRGYRGHIVANDPRATSYLHSLWFLRGRRTP